MSGLEVLIIVLCVLNAVTLGLLVSYSKDSVAQKLLVTQMHTALGTLSGRLAEQSAYLQKVGNAMTEFTNVMDNAVENMSRMPMGPGGQMGMLYRTLDGKYSAQSLEDLIDKIKKDGAEENYLSEDEINGLRKLFEDKLFEDNDEEDFNPDKGKF